MRHAALALLAVAGCTSTVTSNVAPPSTPAAAPEACPPRDSGLRLTADGSAVELISIAIETTISHGLAATRVELTFRNERERVLEGELVVPLPDGASLSAFALEVNGSLREASIVERERARVAFESVVRRKIDPGLAEWSHGNSFRTRVYPIPARGTKRVALGFEQEVRDRFQLDLGPAAKGTLTIDGETRAIDGPIDVALAPLLAPEGVVDSSGAFFARVPLGEPEEERLPRRVTVLWDASLSSRDRDLVKEREILAHVLEGVESIRLVTFAHEVLSRERVASPQQLVERLKGLEADGGTRLACLDVAALESETDAFLLLSDGVASLGGELPRFTKPLAAIVTAPSADTTALGRLGRVVNVRSLSALDAARSLRARPRELVAVQGAGDVFPPPGSRVEGSVLSLSGTSATDLQVLVRDGASVRSVPVTLRRGEGPSRVLARARVARLLAATPVDVAAVVSLAKTARLATPFTSFVVLETLEDYERFEVEPPAELRFVAIERALQAEHFDVAERNIAAVLRDDPSNPRVRPLLERARMGIALRAERVAFAARRQEALRGWSSSTAARIANGVELLQTEQFEKAEEVFRAVLGAEPTNEQAQKYLELAQEGRHWLEGRKAYESRPRDAASDGVAPAAKAATPPAAPVVGPDGKTLVLEFYDVEDLINKHPDFPAPELGLPSGREVPNTYIPNDKVVDFPEDAYWMEKVLRRREGIRAKSPSDAEALPIWGSRVDLGDGAPTAGAARGASRAIARLSSAPRAQLDATYYAERTHDASFYADAADIYLGHGLRDRALRVLTNLADLDPGNPVLLRVLAYRLEEAHSMQLAVSVLERAAALRPEEPQSFRDLALAQAAIANVTSAVANLGRVIQGGWDSRFAGIEAIAARELLRLVAPGSIDADLRVVLTWDANDCDVDLWVTEPSGNKVCYSQPRSATGAQLSRDLTQGYGPEELVLPHAPPGAYLVQAQFYGDRRQTRATDTTLRATIWANYGRPDEERRVVVRRMSERQEIVELARITVAR